MHLARIAFLLVVFRLVAAVRVIGDDVERAVGVHRFGDKTLGEIIEDDRADAQFGRAPDA